MNPEPATVLVLGGSGLLGSALVAHLNKLGVLVDAPSHESLDVLDYRALNNYIAERDPAFIFNCIAYTQVDKAESEPDEAMLYNSDFPRTLGLIIKGKRTFLIHYSTDFVFNGLKKDPYEPDDQTAPLCVYGASKLAGEEELKRLDLENCAILRTAWMFGPRRKNFVHTILGICARNKEANVVQDQVGSPTFTEDLADYSYKFAFKRKSGIYHAVNSGEATWCELAAEAARLVLDECTVNPIRTESLNLPARRPPYSVLDNSSFAAVIGEQPRLWVDALQEYALHDEINFLKGETL